LGRPVRARDVLVIARAANGRRPLIWYEVGGVDHYEANRELLQTADAGNWASEFLRMFRGNNVGGETVDEGLMIGWFANAIEVGRSAAFRDREVLTDRGAELALRRTIEWARGEADLFRTANPSMGRAMALVATHAEDALRTLLLPVP